MPHRQRSIDHLRLHLRRQLQQPQQVRDMTARLVDDLGEHLLRMPIFARQPLIGLRFFDRVEILALDVLDQRDLERLGIVEVANDDRHLVQPRALRRPPAPLARDDLIVMPMRPHHDRLDQPTRRDRRRQLVEHRLVEMPSRLIGMRRQRTDRQHPHARRLRCRCAIGRYRRLSRHLAEQRVEAPAQPWPAAFVTVAHAATCAVAGSRPISSRASAIYACDPEHR